MEDIFDAICEVGVEVDGTPTKPRFELIKAEPSGDATETAAHTLQWVASNQSKAIYVCFQIAINGTHQRYDLTSNGKHVNRMVRRAAFANAGMGRKSPPCTF